MAKDTRHKDRRWALDVEDDGRVKTWQQVEIALLMDIRDELQTLNRTLNYRFQNHFRKGMEAMERTDKRLAKKISLTAKQR